MENIDWSSLSFGYRKTDYNVRCYYRNGKWGELEVSSEETITMHMAATCLHYGQEAFEGMKAFRGKDGKIRLFRMDENAKRMNRSCQGVVMAELPQEIFEAAVIKAVKMNERFVPPYESGASLYIRPLVIGLGAQVGVKPAPEYLFIVFVTPVGPYFKEGFKPTKMAIFRDYDRAAPLGTGTIKVGGNYAAGMIPTVKAHEMGYSAAIFLDAKEKKYIERSRSGQLLRHQEQYLYHSRIQLYPALYHKQESDAGGSGSGSEGRASSGSRRRACYFRRSRCLWYGSRDQPYLRDRRLGEQQTVRHQQGRQTGSVV